MAKRGYFYVVLSAILFGLVPLLTKYIYMSGGNAISVLFYRNLFSLIILVFLIPKKNMRETVPINKVIWIFFVSILVGMTTLLLNKSYELIPTGIATNIHFFYPIIIAIISRIFFKNRLGYKNYFSIIIIIIGLFFLMGFSKGFNLYGGILALLSAVTYGLYILLMEKKELAELNVYITTFLLAFFIVLQILLLHFSFSSINLHMDLKAMLFSFLLAICSSLFGVVFLQKGILILGSTKASMLCLFEPLVSLVCGIVFLREEVKTFTIVGCIFLLLGLYLFFSDKEEADEKVPLA